METEKKENRVCLLAVATAEPEEAAKVFNADPQTLILYVSQPTLLFPHTNIFLFDTILVHFCSFDACEDRIYTLAYVDIGSRFNYFILFL